MMTNRRRAIIAVAVLISSLVGIQSCGWHWARNRCRDFDGVFLCKGRSCLSLYRDRRGQALTYWADIGKQEAPWAIGLLYDGRFFIQRPVWKSAG